MATNFTDQLTALIGAGVDLVCVETMTDLREASIAVRAAKSVSASTPVMATMTFDRIPRGFYTIMGVGIEQAVEGLCAAGADIIGSNCGHGIDTMVEIARRMKALSGRPIVIQSNAGLPVRQGNDVAYPESPAYFSEKTIELIEAGVSIVGGCCGTTPDHIRAIRESVDSLRRATTVSDAPGRADETRSGSAADTAPGTPAGGKQLLGFWTSTSLVVGNMIGSGIFLLPSALAAFGGISIIGWIFTTAGSILLSIVFMRLSRTHPKIGGPYVFAREAFGDLAGFVVAYGYWISILCGNAAIAIASISYLSILFPVLATASHLDTVAALAVLWILTAINVMGVRVSGQGAAGHHHPEGDTAGRHRPPRVPLFRPGAFHPVQRERARSVRRGHRDRRAHSLGVPGLESATIPADNIKDPARTIPRATIVGTSVVALVYIVSTVSVMGILSPDVLARSNAPFADAAAQMFGSAAGYIIAFAGVAACVGALNGWILLQGQMPLAAALDQLFPAMFRARSANGTPVRGIVVSSVLISILLLMNYTEGFVEKFTFVILLATLATLVPYLLSALAQIKFLIREKKGGQVAGPMLVAALALAYSAWAVIGLGGYTIFWGVVCIATGIPVFVWMRRGRSRTAGSN